VKPPAYSSLASFLAHYHVLSEAAHGDSQGAAALSACERDLLLRMERALSALHPEERAALGASAGSGGVIGRRWERAEHKLRRVLTASGILQG
jgi:hypothetical protein